MELTPDEIKIIRKALQIILMAHLVVNTNEGSNYADTKIDALLRRFREAEDNAQMIDTKHVYIDDREREYLKRF